jgi:cytoskeletal protein RodZ
MTDRVFPGKLLLERRESLGHSIQSAYEQTHVPLEYLQAFEAGSFENLPGRAYALGFLRSYCAFLGLEADPFIDQYLFCTQPLKNNGPLDFIKNKQADSVLEHGYPRWVQEALTWATVVLVIILGWFAFTAVIQPLANSWKGSVDAGFIEVEEPVHFNEDF